MDIKQATGAGGLPTNTTSTSGAAQDGDPQADHDYANAVHALFMAGAFVILYPLGVMWLRLFNKVMLHWMNQTVAVFVTIIGAGTGIYIGTMYNKVSSVGETRHPWRLPRLLIGFDWNSPKASTRLTRSSGLSSSFLSSFRCPWVSSITVYGNGRSNRRS